MSVEALARRAASPISSSTFAPRLRRRDDCDLICIDGIVEYLAELVKRDV